MCIVTEVPSAHIQDLAMLLLGFYYATHILSEQASKLWTVHNV